MGRRTLPASDPALISNGSLRRKFNACNESASVYSPVYQERVGAWPDDGDALALTFAQPLAAATRRDAMSTVIR
jgi:hypothetical protein